MSLTTSVSDIVVTSFSFLNSLIQIVFHYVLFSTFSSIKYEKLSSKIRERKTLTLYHPKH